MVALTQNPPLPCFKAYDVRGKVPDELNAELAFFVGRAYAQIYQPRFVVVGYDMRPTSLALSDAVSQGLLEGGASVFDIGMVGTEVVNFATFFLSDQGVDGGIMVTASHNPAEYNGLKFVSNGARPIGNQNGLWEIGHIANSRRFHRAQNTGIKNKLDIWPAYVNHLLQISQGDRASPLHIVTNAGNGGGGLAIDAIKPFVPFRFTHLHHEPDGSFPNGVPNPMLLENRTETSAALKKTNADFGVAFDGDYDRCFFFDEMGNFIEGYYMVGLFAEALLQKAPQNTIVYDPRLIWNTIDVVTQNGGRATQSKCGHAFIKDTMRATNAIYGGEMSAHHYFRDFAYCDSGMLPWLLMAKLLSNGGPTLWERVADRQAKYPASGEINRELSDPDTALEALQKFYGPNANEIDQTDGISMTFGNWRFNLRKSNTENLVRLNVESKGDRALMEDKTAELVRWLEGF